MPSSASSPPRSRRTKAGYLAGLQTGIQRVSRTELTTLDRGQLFATTRRLIFPGSQTNKTIGLGSVSIQVFADAIIVEKTNGRPVTVFMNTDMEVVGNVVQRLLDEA